MKKTSILMTTLCVALFSLLLLTGCDDDPPGPPKTTTLNLSAHAPGCAFPLSGGFHCDIEIWTWDRGTNNTRLWDYFTFDNGSFTGGGSASPKISVPIPESGKFQINVTVEAKQCQFNCCTDCTSTTPPRYGRPVYKGSTGFVEYRANYYVNMQQEYCFCCN